MGQSSEIKKAVERLREGGVVAFPTETVYGLGADALSHHAVAKVFALKGRPANNPLIVHVTGPEMGAHVAYWNDRAARLARAFWPGPLSIVLPVRDNVPRSVTGGGKFVAVRCPDHPVALALLFEFDSPLVGPSANPSGQISPTRAAHVRAAWNEDQVQVLEGGACRAGIESTVLVLDPSGARILRPGVLGAGELAEVLAEPVSEVSFGAVGDSGPQPLASPGTLDRHYAPRLPARLMSAGALASALRASSIDSATCLIVRTLAVPATHARVIVLPENPAAYAAGLYDALRRADDSGATQIVIEEPPSGEPATDSAGEAHIWRAITDRLRRATTPKS